MITTLQGIIIASLVGLLIGILIGYWLMQGRLKRQSKALKDSQQRLDELEVAYEGRLRETTQTLRQEYENELAKTIAHYQDELSQKTLELQQTYETRLQVLQQGLTASVAPAPPADRGIEPIQETAAAPVTQPEILHLKRQYELRLKEAAQKLQQAYEKQLAQHVKSVSAELQADYEKRLADKIEHYDEQFATRREQLEKEYASRLTAVSQLPSAIATPDFPTPSQIMGTGDDTTVTLQPRSPATPPPLVPQPHSPQLTQADIEARIQEATQQIRQDYETQLSSKLEEYQTDLTARMQALENTYKTRLERLTESPLPPAQPAADQAQTEPTAASGPLDDLDDDDFGPLDLSDISQLT